MSQAPAPLASEGSASLWASRDPGTGQIYFPPRALAADGSLRECVPVELAGEGVLYSWTEFNGIAYGQIDLAGDVRVEVLLTPGEHQIGSRYRLDLSDPSGQTAAPRFARV